MVVPYLRLSTFKNKLVEAKKIELGKGGLKPAVFSAVGV